MLALKGTQMHLSQAFYDKGETETRAVQVTCSVGLRCQLG